MEIALIVKQKKAGYAKKEVFILGLANCPLRRFLKLICYVQFLCYIYCSVARCSVPVGLEDKRVRDGAMTASTYYNRYLAPWHGRINHRWSWSARRSVRNQWLQVYFGVLARLTGILSQGRQDANQWVKTFILTFSRDGFKFVKYPKV